MTENTNPTAPATTGCSCRCGLPTNHPASNYLPGHDARHAGNTARVAHAMLNIGDTLEAEALLAKLPSAALQDKARTMLENLQAKASAKAAKQATKAAKTAAKDGRTAEDNTPAEPTPGRVKVGRWTYPARRHADGQVERNDKRDGTGRWAPAYAESFEAN